MVPRAVCAVAGDAGVADGASDQGRRRWWPEQQWASNEAREFLSWAETAEGELRARICSL